MHVIIAFFNAAYASSEKGLKNLCLNEDSIPDHCDAGAVLYQSSFLANWQQIVMWVIYKPVDVGYLHHYRLNHISKETK